MILGISDPRANRVDLMASELRLLLLTIPRGG
jgi:hypothetical protein